MAGDPNIQAARQFDRWLAFVEQHDPVQQDPLVEIDLDELDEIEAEMGFRLPPFYRVLISRLGLASSRPTFADGFDFGLDYLGEIVERSRQSPRPYFLIGGSDDVLRGYSAYYDFSRPTVDNTDCEVASMIFDLDSFRATYHVPIYSSLRDLLWSLSFETHRMRPYRMRAQLLLPMDPRPDIEGALAEIAKGQSLIRVDGPGTSLLLFSGDELSLMAILPPRAEHLHVHLAGLNDLQLRQVQAQLDRWTLQARQLRYS